MYRLIVIVSTSLLPFQPQSPFGKAYSSGNGHFQVADRQLNNYTFTEGKLQRALPAIPPSESDQYIEMHAQSVSSFPSSHSIASSKRASAEYGKRVGDYVETMAEIEERMSRSSRAPSELSHKTQQSRYSQVGGWGSRQQSQRSSRCSMGRVSEHSSLEENSDKSSMASGKTEELECGAINSNDQTHV